MRFSSVLLAGVVLFSHAIEAKETKLTDADRDGVEITVYNQNLALVKDVRSIALKKGINSVAFEGVASSIKPETAMIYAKGIKVLEQNYDYDLLTANNIIDKSVGKEVKTVVQNPTTGENIYGSAKIVNAIYGQPILEFAYGIETHFPGRIVFENLPENLRNKPTLMAKLESDENEEKKLSLAYLTNGIDWQTNYVVNVIDNQNLNLTGWVTINNQSGIDYSDAKVQLVAGDVNQVGNGGSAPRAMMMKSMAMMEDAYDSSVPSQSLSGYHLYTLPLKTDIKDKQSKQISLLERGNVAYEKELTLSSRLHFRPNSNAKFEKIHPNMIYVVKNVETANLGVALPAGVMRFYENDKQGNMQFVGEDSISHVAKGEEMRLSLGQSFDVFVNGKILETKLISEDKKANPSRVGCFDHTRKYAYSVEVDLNNGGDRPQSVIFSQLHPATAKIMKESLKGEKKDAQTYQWKVIVPADGKEVLSFTVENIDIARSCN